MSSASTPLRQSDPLERFEVAAGSVLGREHALAGRNNQDAWACARWPGALAAVVCDGCGSGRASEVGAALGARFVVDALRRNLARFEETHAAAALEAVRLDVLARLGQVLEGLGAPRATAVHDHLLFTVVGTVVTPTRAWVFTSGDGVVILNGRVLVLDSPDNAPAYLAYQLTGASDDASLRFVIRDSLPTDEIASLALGSDGVRDLLKVGAAEWLWKDDRLFRNPAALTRRLRQLNQAPQRIDWERRRVEREAARLPDDTTLVVIRRREGAG